MPRALVLGVLGVIAIGSIAVGGRRSDPPPQSNAPLEFDAPVSVATANKSDRLQTLAEKDVELSKQITEVSFVVAQQTPQPAPPTSRPKPTPDFVPRHWHDPYASKPETQKRASVAKKSTKRSPDKVQASVAKECSTDGFAPFLRKLRLAADCDS